MPVVDVNADLGESFGRWTLGNDEALLAIVSSANIACGFHAGDPQVLRRTCRSAAARRVVVGAQVGYRDLPGFGRRFIDVTPADLIDDVIYQIGALGALAAAEGTRVSYVKPHGALYNAIVTHQEQAAAVVEAVRLVDPTLAVLGLPGSRWLTLADSAGLYTVTEAFADRGYTAVGTLVPRSAPGALLTDAAVIAARAVRMVTKHRVRTVEGTDIEVHPQSVCVHGDTPGAVAIAGAVRSGLEDAGVTVSSFAADPGSAR